MYRVVLCYHPHDIVTCIHGDEVIALGFQGDDVMCDVTERVFTCLTLRTEMRSTAVTLLRLIQCGVVVLLLETDNTMWEI